MTQQMTVAHVDGDRCVGYGICVEQAPEIFDLNDDGQATAVPTPLPPQLLGKAQQAAAMCPVRAIRLTTAPSTASAIS